MKLAGWLELDSDRTEYTGFGEGYTLSSGWCHPFCRIATPFWAKGVAILQIT